MTDLFGVGGRQLLERLAIPEPWGTTLATSLALVDELDAGSTAASRSCASWAPTTPYIPLL